MAKINKMNFQVGVNPENLAERIFEFEQQEQARGALQLVESLMLRDKAFKQAVIDDVGKLVVETHEPSNWVSPGIEHGSRERQSHLFRCLGEVGLA